MDEIKLIRFGDGAVCSGQRSPTDPNRNRGIPQQLRDTSWRYHISIADVLETNSQVPDGSKHVYQGKSVDIGKYSVDTKDSGPLLCFSELQR